jgi:hypothetical protein
VIFIRCLFMTERLAAAAVLELTHRVKVVVLEG